MKPRFYFFAVVAMTMVCAVGLFAQGLETVGGPYTVDSNTVVLLHFDGSMTNAAAAIGKTDTVAVRNTTNPSKIYFLNNTAIPALGQCVRLDNGAITDSTYLTIADTSAVDLTGSFTIEAWANIFSFGDNAQDYRWVPRVCMKPADVTFYDGANWWLEMWGDNRLFHGGYVAESGNYVSVTSPNNMFVPGEWVHLTFIRDAARGFIAVMVHDKDKVLKGFLTKGFTIGDAPKTTKQAVHIGWAGAKGITNASNDSWLDGFIDELRISKVARNFAGPPVISDVTILPNQPTTATSYAAGITVFPLNAGGSITSVVLKYRTDTTSAFSSVPLTGGANNRFTGVIPATTFGKQVQYYYVATDNNAMTAMYPSDAEAATSPTRLSFYVYQPNAMTLDLTFEEGPSGNPVDHSPNAATIVTRVQKDYSTDVPMGGGNYSWQLKTHPGVAIDSNWVEAVSPFLAAEEFTMDCWLKADSTDRHAVRIIINPSAEKDWNNANFELSLRNGGPGVPVFTARYWANDLSAAYVVQDTVAGSTHIGKWRHIILERKANPAKFAMVIKDENDAVIFHKIVDAPKPPIMAGAPMRIGRSWFDGADNYYVGPYRGRIDNVKLYNYAATGATAGVGIDQVGGPYTPDANTVVLLHFDGNMTNSAAAIGKTDTAAVRNTTNPSKIYFLNNTAVPSLGQCVRLDNGAITDSTYLTVADTAALDLTGSFTIEAWANIFTFGDNAQDYRWVPRVCMKPADVTFYDGANWWLEMWGDNRLFHGGYVAESGSYVTVTSPNNMFVPGEWVHLTFINDTARAFIAVMVHDKDKNLKGFLTKGFTKGDRPKTTRQAMHIGWAGAKGITNASNDSWLDGFVDELRVSNVVRKFAGPPVIAEVTILPNQPTTAANYPVSITVFPLNAGGSISSVSLKYRTDTTGSFSTVALSGGAQDKYTGTIPSTTFGKKVQYYYVATDNNGQGAMYPSDAEAATNPTLLSFYVYQPHAMTLDLTFEEGPSGNPVDHSPNGAQIVTRVQKDYSTDVPTGGGVYSWQLKTHAGVSIDSNWVEAVSPFLAAEEFTMDCWLKADSTDRHAVRIIINPSKENDWNNANFELSLRNGGPGVPVFTARYWANDLSVAYVVQDTLAGSTHIGKWRHIILERNASSNEFAMAIKDENDALLFKKAVAAPKPPIMAGAPMRIGRSWFDGADNYYVGPYRGRIDNVKVYNYPAAGITTGVDGEQETPLVFALAQNYPNPFNPTTRINFTVPVQVQTKLLVYDILGRQVKTLVNDVLHAGQHFVQWDGTNGSGAQVASGVYFVRMTAGQFEKTTKMMLMR